MSIQKNIFNINDQYVSSQKKILQVEKEIQQSNLWMQKQVSSGYHNAPELTQNVNSIFFQTITQPPEPLFLNRINNNIDIKIIENKDLISSRKNQVSLAVLNQREPFSLEIILRLYIMLFRHSLPKCDRDYMLPLKKIYFLTPERVHVELTNDELFANIEKKKISLAEKKWFLEEYCPNKNRFSDKSSGNTFTKVDAFVLGQILRKLFATYKLDEHQMLKNTISGMTTLDAKVRPTIHVALTDLEDISNNYNSTSLFNNRSKNVIHLSSHQYKRRWMQNITGPVSKKIHLNTASAHTHQDDDDLEEMSSCHLASPSPVVDVNDWLTFEDEQADRPQKNFSPAD